ncbi:hypothetical protein D3C73_1600770 [compost metagenome]
MLRYNHPGRKIGEDRQQTAENGGAGDNPLVIHTDKITCQMGNNQPDKADRTDHRYRRARQNQYDD